MFLSLTNRRLINLWQKMTRGFSDDVTWNLDTELAKWLLPRLKRFKELNNGYPDGLTPESWDEKLDKMIKALQIHIHEDDISIFLGIPDEDLEPHRKGLQKEKEEGLKLLTEYIGHLWW